MPFTRSGKNTFGNSLEEKAKKMSIQPGKKKLKASPTNMDTENDTPSGRSTLSLRKPLHQTVQLDLFQSPPTNEEHPPVALIDTNSPPASPPQQNKPQQIKAIPRIQRFIPKHNYIVKRTILITIVIIAIAVSIWQVTLPPEVKPPHRPSISEYGDCVSELAHNFSKQSPLLWKQIVKSYSFNQERRRTVLCQTFITNPANRHPLDCLIRKLSACLDEKDPYMLTAASDPVKSASMLERELNLTDKRVGYFREITDLTHPIPIVFHAICDPDHSPYKERVFFFTISTDSLNKKSGEYSHRDISNSINEVLNKYWATELFPSEQIAAVISRIADSAYYFLAEGDEFKC